MLDLPQNAAFEQEEKSPGTRFWIFPQPSFVPGYEKPDRVWLSVLRDEIAIGPGDISMYVVDPVFDKQPYGSTWLPPFEGSLRRPAQPAPDRHYDHLDPAAREFLGVHAYACVHFVMDIWKSYLGRPVRWFFDPTFPRLEIIPFVNWENAQAGYGFLELGYSRVGGVVHPYALNFDTIAHELGHLIILSETGFPARTAGDSDFFPFAEAFSDCISLVSMLHFDSAMDRLLRRTQGNLLLYNELNRFAETSPESQIRLATNFRKMSEVTQDIHDRALPFVGAVFDSIVELYHRDLVSHGFAAQQLLDIDLRDLTRDEFNRFRAMTADAYATRPLYFKLALIAARDAVGQALARALGQLDPTTLRFDQAARTIVASASMTAADPLEANFRWREIITAP